MRVSWARSAVIVLVLVLGVTEHLAAQVRSSNNYQIQSDSINVGGGFSSSTNYRQESTVGEVATGRSTSTSYNLRAGFQQMQEAFIAINGANDVAMNATIPGIGGGTAVGSTTVTVITDSPAGYQLSIQAADSPAMQSGANSIADYAPAGGNPDLVFTTDSTDSHLAYSPFGTDVVERFLTDGNNCNVSGSASSTACWDGLSTTEEVIAQSASANQPDGTDTSVYFQVGIGSAVIQPAGTYVATTTVTAIAL